MNVDVQGFAVAHLRRRPLVVEVGGFVAGFDPATDSPHVNYATPVPGAEPGDAEIAELVAAFRERGLLPRLEFAPDAVPGVEKALDVAGFTTEEVHDYLVCTPQTLRVPGGLPVAAPVSDADFRAVDAALSEAFTGVTECSETGVARLRRTEESGGAVRFVRASDGGCAGAATCSAPAVGTAELSSVGTRPAYREQGVAASVTAALTATMFDRGASSVWLEYSGDGSRRVYERLGFRPQGTRTYMSLPAGEPGSR